MYIYIFNVNTIRPNKSPFVIHCLTNKNKEKKGLKILKKKKERKD